MAAELLRTWDDPPNPRHLDRAVDVLAHDGVLALPTGSSWAFAADPSSKKANDRLRRLKPDHGEERPFALLCSSISMAARMAVIGGDAYRLVHNLWPGPYTVILPAGRDLPRVLKTKRAVVGVRVPDARLATAIAERFGGPLVVTTVPPGPDGLALATGHEVHARFGEALDLVLDLGVALPGTETTVLDLTRGEVEVVRVGAGDLAIL